MQRSVIGWMAEPLRKYATFSGRAEKFEFWWFQLAMTLFVFATQILLFFVSVMTGPANPAASVGLMVIYLILWLGLLIPQLAVTARRLHDTDHRGWWMLAPMLAFVPIIAGFAAHRQALFAGLATGADVRNAASSFALIGVGYLLAMVLGTLLMVWYCTNGTVGPNRFGSDPHES